MTQPQYRRPGTTWFVIDGYIWDDLPASYRREGGRPLECSSRLFVFNPQGKMARVRLKLFHVDRTPTSVELKVRPRSIGQVELAALPEVPHRQSFWIAIESDRPVLPQARHEDYTFWDPVPDAMVAVAPYPGPLSDETSWAFPDCFQGGSRSWYERETLTILNPGKRPVSARVRYLFRNREAGGEEEIEIAGERVAALEVWERSRRLLGTGNGPSVRVLGDYAVRVDATGPVIAQTTRRARWHGHPSIIGSRSTMGFPVRAGRCDLWYYPGGAVWDRGVLPRAKETDHPLSQCDNTWNLLFINNLDPRRRVRAQVRFHKPDGAAADSGPLPIPPLKSVLHCLHGKPWLGEQIQVNQPFAITLTADGPVVPEVCCAEYEMWSQVCPGAMTAVNFYPGPLRQERTWWLGIGQAGGSDQINVEWAQSYHLFNPGQKPAQVTLSFLGLGNRSTSGRRQAPVQHSVKLAPGAVVHVASADIAGLPLGRPFAVRADSDRPFCAQVFGRTFTRGLRCTRGMYSHLGIPMTLEG
jgi:hypothetical protein